MLNMIILSHCMHLSCKSPSMYHAAKHLRRIVIRSWLRVQPKKKTKFMDHELENFAPELIFVARQAIKANDK